MGGRGEEWEEERGQKLPRISMKDKQEVMKAITRGVPFVLTDLGIGSCVGKWTPEYLYAAASAKLLSAGKE